MSLGLAERITAHLPSSMTYRSAHHRTDGHEARQQTHEIITYISIIEKLQRTGIEGMLVSQEDAYFFPREIRGNQISGDVRVIKEKFFPELNSFLSRREKDFLFTQLLRQMSLSQKSGVTQATGPDTFGFFEVGYDPVVRGNAIQMVIERMKGHHGYYSAPVVLQFNSDKDVICNGHIPLGRFCLPIGDPVQDQELQGLIENNSFPLGSEVIYIDGSPVVKVPIIKYYKIGADQIDLHEIAKIRAKERGKLDILLQLIETSKDSLNLLTEDGNPHYLLAEAGYFSIPQQYHFVMFPYAKISSGRAFSRHLRSFLLDRGFEGKLRLEIQYQDEVPEFVYVIAYKAALIN